MLAELFHDDWAAGQASGFARAAAARARRLRRLQRALLSAGAVTAISAVLLFGGVRRSAPMVAKVSVPKRVLAYEIISDDELIAQLRDRPLLVLPKENGTREFVLLEN